MAIDLFDEFAANTNAEEEGVWEAYGDDTKFLIARATNKHYTRALTRAYEKNKRTLDGKGEAAEAVSEEIMVGVIARTILLGWEKVIYQKKPLEYSMENARTLLAHKDFRAWVMGKANDFDRFKLAQEAEDEGKSGA